MPLCIAGMHRSCTSMIARLLRTCGLYLGREKDMLPPAADNPDGFCEHRSFLRMNDAVLKSCGGTWERPPLAPRIGQPSRFDAEARKLIRQFRGREPWGWKDPRNCLTLPLWRKTLPELKVLICVRNPLGVAKSLHARNGIPIADGFDLWLTYNRSALAAVTPEERVVTNCESFFHDPLAELRRVLRLLDLDATEEQVESACARIKPSMLHFRVTVDDLLAAGTPEEVAACYFDLCGEADWDAGRPAASTASMPYIRTAPSAKATANRLPSG